MLQSLKAKLADAIRIRDVHVAALRALDISDSDLEMLISCVNERVTYWLKQAPVVAVDNVGQLAREQADAWLALLDKLESL